LRVKAEQLPKVLEEGPAGIHLVSGDEPLLVNEAADAVRAAARAAGHADRRVVFVEKGFAWDELRQEAQSLSLFANRRLLEVRMPGGKPDKGATLLADLAARPVPDLSVLVITGRLDRKAAEAAWVKAIERHGVWVAVWPVAPDELPAWLSARARLAGARLDADAAELIAVRVEGNLLAAQQELEKLVLLAAGAPIGPALVLGAVGDSARYDVFQLSEAAAGGDAARALRILFSLRSEGTEPTLVLWALTRELRGLWQSAERDRLQSSGRSGWNLASVPAPRALSRRGRLPLAGLLEEAGRADRIIKGLASGDSWTALIALTASLAGALQPGGLSGRVAR
jgi:DNA polymerase-3 subunit delta